MKKERVARGRREGGRGGGGDGKSSEQLRDRRFGRGESAGVNTPTVVEQL